MTTSPDALLRTYDRRHKVPQRAGLTTSLCHCGRWYARPPRFRQCHGCTTVKSRFRDAITQVSERREVVTNERSGPNGEPLYLALARIAALRKDHPNIRREDLRPEWRPFWV